MKAQAELSRGFDEGLEDAMSSSRKDVVMVGGERAAGEEEPGHRGPGGYAHAVSVDPRPHRIEGAKPFEQGAVGHVTPGGPLVHVVVGIDQARHGDAVGLIQHLVRRRWRARADLQDHPVSRQHPAVFDLPAAGEDEPGLDEKRQRIRSCGLIGTRAMSRPVAARIAATIAGPEEIVGGSPTPFKP